MLSSALPALTWEVTVLAAVAVAFSLTAMLHVLVHHRDHRSAGFWVALILFSPIIGPSLYALLGINFVRRKGRDYRGAVGVFYRQAAPECPVFSRGSDQVAESDCSLAMTLDRISRFHFCSGNQVGILQNGDEAMPSMLEAIRGARVSISLASYIFEAKGIGGEFLTGLAAAVSRGVDVRVIVDDAGTRYSWPPVTRELGRLGVPVRRFMPNHLVMRLVTMNLRNHKKLLIIDGKTGFTGGMNIRQGNMIQRQPPHPVRDLHFKVQGPVVEQMQRVFAEDWHFCSGEVLEGDAWFPPLTAAGSVHALGIVDGPDEDIEVMPAALFAALNAARRRVRVITPYFLPTGHLLAALKLCALRGVEVSIITPGRNNIPLVAWAARTLYPDLIQAGCRVYESPPPFDHSKMLLVDDAWCFIGSTNWDPRSLRLNFEFNLACHDPALAAGLGVVFDGKKAECGEVTSEMLAAISVAQRLRNGFASLFIPVL